MGNEIALAIPIAPEPKARPRFAVVHGHVETYTPKKTKTYENFVAAFYKAAAKGFKFEKGDSANGNDIICYGNTYFQD